MPLLVTAAVVLMHCFPGADLDADDVVGHVAHGQAAPLDCVFHVHVLTWAIALAKQRRLQGGWHLEFVVLGAALFSAWSLKPFRVRGCPVECLTSRM